MVVVEVQALPMARANVPGRWAAARVRVIVFGAGDWPGRIRECSKVWTTEVPRRGGR